MNSQHGFQKCFWSAILEDEYVKSLFQEVNSSNVGGTTERVRDTEMETNGWELGGRLDPLPDDEDHELDDDIGLEDF